MGCCFMKFKKIMLISILLVILTAGAVCASDINETSDDLAINEGSFMEVSESCDNSSGLSASDDEILSTGEGSFSDIQTMIDNAAEGDTIVLSGNDYLGSGTQITVSKRVTIDGNNSTLNAGHASRIFNIIASDVVLKNIILSNGNSSSSSGGAVYWLGDNGNMTNCRFSDNHAHDGGAVYYKGSNGVIENTVFINNSAFYNGAVYMNSLNAKIINCTFTSNCATNSSGALGWVKKGNGVISNSKFIKNAARYGGAIYINNATDLRIENSEFYNNSAVRKGGSLYWDSVDNGTIIDSKFKNSTAGEFGGGIYYDECGNMLASNCSFAGCSVKSKSGGAIYCYSADGVNVSIAGCSFVNCNAGESGGAIRLFCANSTVSGCTFVKCYASESGAIYWSGDNGTVSDCSFVDCSAVDEYYARGGAIFWDGDNGTVSGCSFVNCSAAGDCSLGGAIYWDYLNNCLVSGCSFVNCSVVASDEFDACGGAIYWASNSGSLSGCSFVNCSAVGVYASGGAIFWFLGHGSVFGCSFMNCSAEYRGGAIYFDVYEESTIKNSSFINNNAGEGRSIYADDEDKVSISNSKFIDKKGLNGAIYGGTSSNCTLVDNLATTTTLTLSATTVSFGEKILITPKVFDQYACINGFVKLYVDGESIGTCSIGENFAYTPEQIGTYSVAAKFEGDEYYLASQSEGFTFEVEKVTPKMDISIEDIEYGGNLIINVTLPSDATNDVTVNLNGLNCICPLTGGFASAVFSDLGIGAYAVTVFYSGDSNYKGVSNGTTFVVRPNVVISQNAVVGDDVNVFMNFGCNVTDQIIVKVDNRIVGVLDIDEGIVNGSFSTAKLTAGNHNVTFGYDGDNAVLKWFAEYSGNSPMRYSLNLLPKEVNIPESFESNDDGVIILVFPENATGTVEVFVDGVKAMVVEIVNGVAKIDLSKYKGKYSIVFKYSGDEVYAPFTKDALVDVYVKAAKITASNIKLVYTSKNKYSVKVYDSDGKLASGVKVTFLINNKAYKTATTGSNGVASIVIGKVPGSYKITAKVSRVSVTKKLTVNHLLTLKTVKVKRSAKKLVLTATLKKVNGKYLKKKKVTFRFNGKKYVVKTNKKGVAKVTINSKVLKKLKAGKKVKYQATYLKDTVVKTVKVKK